MIYLGAFIHPTAYTLTAVTSLNGSPVNGSCPQECVGMVRDTRTCDCTTVPDQNTTGVLIDGMIPTINQFNSVGNVSLTSDMENCESLTWVTISLQTAANTQSYYIQFTNIAKLWNSTTGLYW